MNYKRIILLCISAFLFLGGYAQDLREVNVEKPGKLGKLVKKELATISKLKVTGTLNCEDVNVLSQMPMLEYLDLRDISFDYDDKHNDPVCMDNKGTFYLHAPIGNLREFFVPKGAKGLSLTNYKDQTILFSANIRKDEINYYKNLNTRYGSPYKSILENVIVHIPFGCIIDTPIKVVRIDGDPCQEYANGFLLGLNQVKDKLVIEKVETAKVLHPYFDQLKVPIIFIEEYQWLHVNEWKGNSITKEQLKKIDSFKEFELGRLDGLFSDLKLPNDIELSDRLMFLPERLFYDHNEVTSITLPEGLIKIGALAIPSSVTRIKIPATVMSVGYLDVDTIELESQMPPEWLNDYSSSFSLENKNPKHHFVIPDGTLKEYYAFRNDLDYIDNAPGGSYTINVPKGNTILSYISLDDLICCDSLTISGILYEQDFNFIKKAQRLKYLDISQCYTTYSEEFMKELEQKDKAMAAIFNAISDQLDVQYQDYQIGTIDYKINKVIADEIAKVYSQGYSKDEMCVIPHQALEDMKSLEYVKLPILVTRIGPMAFSACSNLKIVEFPPYLTQISKQAFEFCHKLKNFELPKTVNWIQSKAFYNCNSLTKFVFPDVKKFDKFKYEDDILSACVSLEEIVYSEGMEKIPTTGYKCYSLRKVTIPSTATQINIQDRNWDEKKCVPCEFHIKATTPPSFYTDNYLYKDDWGDNATIFIPRGTITAYTAKYGTRLKYVEE